MHVLLVEGLEIAINLLPAHAPFQPNLRPNPLGSEGKV